MRIGGRTLTALVLALGAWSAPAQAASWQPAPPMPGALYEPAAALGSDGNIYVVGGGRVTGTVFAFDPASGRWTRRAPLHVPRSEVAVAAGSDGLIYAIGGYEDYDHHFAGEHTIEAYDPVTNSWQERAPMPTGRYDLAAVSGPDGRIYAIGGRAKNGALLSRVEAYDPRSDTWTRVTDLPYPVAGLGAALAADGRIDAVGGGVDFDQYCGYLDTATRRVRAFDVSANAWLHLTRDPIAAVEPGVAATPDGRVYAIGGEEWFWTGSGCEDVDDIHAQVEVYDPALGQWQAGPDLPDKRARVAAVATPDGAVYAIGGVACSRSPCEDPSFTRRVDVLRP